MSSRSSETQARREFVRSLFRYVAFGVLAGGSFFLTSKRKGADASECINDYHCRGCPRYCDCALSDYSAPDCEPDCDGRQLRKGT